ncbi:metallophosphoesterase [Clostridium sp. D2Q-11]|uniref:Metallophosphoesterase n=2 Tax=Anaeromonas frigoriresistens TaxID=2683708 RepID=A0A942UQR5_9FIRM|nr:metallophosphoesterase [Anaeromonas frigoriresistens]
MIIIGVIIFILIVVFLYLENNLIEVTKIEVDLDKDIGGFEGYRIVHLSDLHNKKFGDNQDKIIRILENLNPDIIFFTGDLIDSRRKGIDNGIALLDRASKLAEVYYITGNHEERTERYLDLYKELKKINIDILEDSKKTVSKNGYELSIVGLRDSSIQGLYGENISATLSKFQLEEKDINILLAHRPSYIDYYSKYPFDLVFSGHAHGGQIRLPVIGGLLSPGQGLLPKYDSGVYLEGKTRLIVSRGLGNSIFPQRILNRPEIILTILNSK